MSLIGMILGALLAVGLYELGQRFRPGARSQTEVVVAAVFVVSFLVGAALFATLADGLRIVATVGVLLGVGSAVGWQRRSQLDSERRERLRLETELERLREVGGAPGA